MNAAHAIRRLEEAGFTHQQATGVVEVVQGEVIEKVATRDYVGEQIALVRKDLGEQIALVRKELAEQIGAARAEAAREAASIRQALAEQIGAVRQELAQGIGEARAELLAAINRQTVWMNGLLVAILIAVVGLFGVLIGKL
jgi:acyl-CoA reductase-like NAD-dependent aldehyde dehydrogenase